MDVAHAYERATAAGLEYGPAFRGMRRLSRGNGEALAEVALDDGVEGAELYGIHPALLDAAFHAALGLSETEDGLSLPFAIERLTVNAPGAAAARVHVRAADSPEAADESVDVTLTDEQGLVLAEVKGLRVRRLDAEALGRAFAEDVTSTGDLYRVDWPAAAATSPSAALTGRWVVVASREDSIAHALAHSLVAAGVSCEHVEPEATR